MFLCVTPRSLYKKTGFPRQTLPFCYVKEAQAKTGSCFLSHVLWKVPVHSPRFWMYGNSWPTVGGMVFYKPWIIKLVVFRDFKTPWFWVPTLQAHNFVDTGPQNLVPKPLKSQFWQVSNGFGTTFRGSVSTKLWTCKVGTQNQGVYTVFFVKGLFLQIPGA